ncbi:MAG: LuxR C-terminal-related transcriptional regulator, partial [Clostridia bacterium]|nr:LuxR C-terminal-related transcriptional regulator [Clostridia bacterium]
IYCELTQSKTLFMKNSTVIGNSAESSGGICVTPMNTNFDSTPRAQICLSTLLGKQDLGDHASLFGCLIGDNSAVPCEPSAENGYCLTVSETALRDRCGVNGTSHISLPAGDHPLTREATESIAGGKFANSLGLLKVGDNYCKETTFSLVSAKKNVATFTVRYGETVRLEDPERNGFSFTGWRYADGTELNAETVFIGGDLPEDMLVAEWNLEPMKNGFVLGGFGILLLGALTVLLLLLLKKRKPEVLTEEQPMPCEKVLPENWINLVFERPDVTEAVSRREMDVLRKLLEGKSRKQIADELFISEATVKKHSASIYGKFKVHNRNELLFKLTK